MADEDQPQAQNRQQENSEKQPDDQGDDIYNLMTEKIAKYFQQNPSDNPGDAKQWIPEGEESRRDKSISTLRLTSIFGFLGIDHFYLRSPFTGLVKLLTLGGVGIWWIWDLLQAYTQTDRVIAAGLEPPPFFENLIDPVGRGMITAGEPKFAQRSSYSWWQVAALFSFVGWDSFLLGKIGQGARKITELIFLLVGVVSLVIAWRENGLSGLIGFGKIITILMVIFFGGIVLTNWAVSLSTIFMSPAKLFEHGIKLSQKTDKALNSYTAIIDLLVNYFGMDKDTADQVKKDMNYGSTDGAEFKKLFAIERKEDLEKEADASSPASESGNTWLKSFSIWLGLLVVFAVQLLISAVMWIVYLFAPWLKIAKAEADKAVEGINAATKAAQDPLGAAASVIRNQAGGARRSADTELSTEAKVLGAAVVALVGGGALKAAVDYLVAE